MARPSHRFQFGVTTFFLTLAVLSLVAPLVLGWNIHSAPGLALVCTLLFWVALALAGALSLFRAIKTHTAQNWIELALCAGLLALVVLLFG